jgi:hypothetical protein
LSLKDIRLTCAHRLQRRLEWPHSRAGDHACRFFQRRSSARRGRCQCEQVVPSITVVSHAVSGDDSVIYNANLAGVFERPVIAVNDATIRGDDKFLPIDDGGNCCAVPVATDSQAFEYRVARATNRATALASALTPSPSIRRPRVHFTSRGTRANVWTSANQTDVHNDHLLSRATEERV